MRSNFCWCFAMHALLGPPSRCMPCPCLQLLHTVPCSSKKRVEQSKTRGHAVGPCLSHLSLPSVAQSASHQLRTLGVLFISLYIPLSLKVKECHSSRKYLCHYETTWWQPSTTATATATIEHAKHETTLIRNFGSKLLLLNITCPVSISLGRYIIMIPTGSYRQIWRPCTKL